MNRFSFTRQLLLSLVFLSSGYALTSTWTNAGADQNWTTGGNWDTGPNFPNAVDDVAVFGNASATNSISVDTNITVGSVDFNDTTDTYSFSGANTLIFETSGANASLTSDSNPSFSNPIQLNNDLDVQFGEVGGSVTISGVISGTGGINSSLDTVTLSASNTYTGATTITGGQVTLSGENGDLSSSTSVTISNNATLALTSSNYNSFNISSEASGGNLTLSGAGGYGGVISGLTAVTKSGEGSFTLTANHTYTGATTISSGTLALDESNANLSSSTTVSLTSSTSIFQVGGNTSYNSFSVSLNDAESKFSATTSTGTNTYGGVISGSGGFTKTNAGTFVLTGTNTYTGSTTVSGGTLTLSGASGNLSSSTSVSVASGATLSMGTGSSITYNSFDVSLGAADAAITLTTTSGTDTYGGVISGSGTLTKSGDGAFTLSGNNTLSGATSVSAGTLNVTGQLSNSTTTVSSGATLKGTGTMGDTIINGTCAPGLSIGTITVSGNYTQSSGSTLEIEIDADGNTDLLDISGTATIESNATLNIVPADGSYTAGTTYTFLDADGGLTGTFDTVNIQNESTLDPNSLEVSYTSGSAIITVTSPSSGFTALLSQAMSLHHELSDRMTKAQMQNMSDMNEQFWIYNNTCCDCSENFYKKKFRYYALTNYFEGMYQPSTHNLAGDYFISATSTGFEYIFSEEGLMSLGFGYTDGKVKDVDSKSTVYGQSYTLLPRLLFSIKEIIALNLFGTIDWFDYQMSRKPTSVAIPSTSKGLNASLQSQLLGRFCVKGLNLLPYGSIIYSYHYISNYTEKRTSNQAQKVRHHDFDNVEGVIGMLASISFDCGKDRQVIPYLEAKRIFEINNRRQRINSTNLNNHNLLLTIIDPLKVDYTHLEGGVSIQKNEFSAFLKGAGIFGDHHQWGFQIGGGFDFSF